MKKIKNDIDNENLNLLNKLTDKNQNKDYDSVEDAFNNIKYPRDNMTDNEKFDYGVGVVTKELVKLNYTETMEKFNALLDNKDIKTNTETEEIMNILQNFYDNIIEGKYSDSSIKLEYEKLYKTIHDKTSSEKINEFINNNAEKISNYINYLPFFYLSSLVDEYVDCDHQVFISGIIDYVYIQNFIINYNFFEIFKQFEYGFIEFCVLHIINAEALKRALKVLAKLPTTNWNKQMILKSNNDFNNEDAFKSFVESYCK